MLAQTLLLSKKPCYYPRMFESCLLCKPESIHIAYALIGYLIASCLDGGFEDHPGLYVCDGGSGMFSEDYHLLAQQRDEYAGE